MPPCLRLRDSVEESGINTRTEKIGQGHFRGIPLYRPIFSMKCRFSSQRPEENNTSAGCRLPSTVWFGRLTGPIEAPLACLSLFRDARVTRISHQAIVTRSVREVSIIRAGSVVLPPKKVGVAPGKVARFVAVLEVWRSVARSCR